jgi:protein ImuB
VGDLYAVPPAALVPRAGRTVARRLDQALGRVAEPIDPLVPRPELSARVAFVEPIGLRDDLAAGIARLIGTLCARLGDAGQGARRLGLTLYRVDGTVQPVEIGTSRASREPDHLKRLFAEHLDDLDAGFGVEVMTLAALSVEPLSARQMALREGGRGEREGLDAKAAGDLTSLIDRLTNRFGADSVTRPRPAGSHWPERAVRPAPPLSRDTAAWPATPPRPVRLFAPPVPVDVARQHPEAPPDQLRYRKLTHKIRRHAGPERLSPEWWRAPAEPHACRDHHTVETTDGRRYWLTHDGRTWAVAGVFG